MDHAPSHSHTREQQPIWRWAAIAPILLALDQVAKYLVVRTLGPGADRHEIDVLGRVVRFQYVENRGAAFGAFPTLTMVFAAVSVLAIGAGVWIAWTSRHRQPMLSFCAAMVIGGAIGNLLDRLIRGFVVDFIAVGWWPRFNIADAAVCIGMIAGLWLTLGDDSGRTDERRTEPHDI